MAWVEKLSSGRWRGCYRTPSGQRLYVTDGGKGYGRKMDAREAAQEAEVRARREAATVAGTLSARITWGQWWNTIADSRRRSDSDYDINERSIVKLYVMPRWGTVPLNKIERRPAQDWINSIDKSPSYVRKIWAVFSATITTALDKGVLTASPCAGVKLPKVPRKPNPYLSTEQSAQLADLGQLRADYQDAVNFGLDTGLRPNEICGLHACSIDLDAGWVTVTHVMLKEKKRIRPCPKDKDSRMVPMSDRAVEIARRRLAGRDLSRGCGVEHTDGAACDSPLVFLTELGRPMRQNAWGMAMRKAARAAGVSKRSPYSIRRGFATRAARGGVDAFALADLMGHATMDQSRQYVQETPGARDRLRRALGEVEDDPS